MTQTIDEPLTTSGGPAQRRAGPWHSLLNRVRGVRRAEPDTGPRQNRPDLAYRVLEDARAVLAQGWVQDHWYARLAVRSRSGEQTLRPRDSSGQQTLRPPDSSRKQARPPDGSGEVGACLVGAVVHAARWCGPGDPLVTAGPALDYLWDAWQESRGLGGTGVCALAAPRELRLVRVRDLTRWNDQPGRTREEVLGLVDLAAGHAVMAAMRRPR